MKIRRIRRPDSESPVVQSLNNGVWVDISDPPEFCYRGSGIRRDAGSGGTELPFQPISFRDFMLYEKHVIDASRGYARRFMPGAYRFAALFEGLARRPFPAFRPRPLWYRQPIYYLGNHLTFVPSGSPVHSPSYSHALDYELELGFVLARPLRDATPEDAMRAIGGFVVLNDLSARDVQRDEMSSGFGPQKSKHFLSSMSEVVVTADEVLSEVDSLRASVTINGEQIASMWTSGMRYSLGEALAHASRDEQLFPGELFGTGTLPGGSGMECGRWLQPGDELLLRIDRIGEIRHSII
ncbi:2-keto-4-pentenoate hydratase/2-oxohepta-3-ene-1,7-dioic acid hydratase in catechol pathway [Rhizobium sp. ERR 922]|nr:2-keto-4-pentenoate hydratase/2-oxohepta-3-ene-1,7-dioic acid hydratase in catechol pathway [Rhizobium sp. ERR 922]TWB88789.1 2-keto-4-pentenoate hydratase/2-oxohepta-3-ene-1,7-dioic acid hydratase in catechol pathway [Rhizobium sp. ERR 942]